MNLLFFRNIQKKVILWFGTFKNYDCAREQKNISNRHLIATFNELLSSVLILIPPVKSRNQSLWNQHQLLTITYMMIAKFKLKLTKCGRSTRFSLPVAQLQKKRERKTEWNPLEFNWMVWFCVDFDWTLGYLMMFDMKTQLQLRLQWRCSCVDHAPMHSLSLSSSANNNDLFSIEQTPSIPKYDIKRPRATISHFITPMDPISNQSKSQYTQIYAYV